MLAVLPVVRPIILVPAILLGCLITAPRAEAHALSGQCKLVGNSVELEAYFDDDSPAADAKVRVLDGAKTAITEGRTDAKGRWSFPRPAMGKYVVVIDAGAGHRTEIAVTIPAGDAAASSADDDCCCCEEPSSSSSPSPSLTVSDGPDRATFTGYLWLKLGIGLAVIGGLAAAFVISRRLGHTAG